MCVLTALATAGTAIAGAIGSAGAAASAAGASTLLQGAATGVSALSAITGGISQYQQARTAEDMAKMRAQDALARGDEAASDLAKEQASLRGQQRAALAASGVEIDFGSAGKIQSDTASMQREDMRRLRQNARREAWGYSVEAAMADSAAQNAVISTVLNTGSTLLEGASKTWQGYKNNRPITPKPTGTYGPVA